MEAIGPNKKFVVPLGETKPPEILAIWAFNSGGEMEVFFFKSPTSQVAVSKVRLPKLLKPRTIVVQVWELQRRLGWVIGWDVH